MTILNWPVLSKGLINYQVYKNGEPTKPCIQHDRKNIKEFFAGFYKKSNKEKSGIFWDDILIVESGKQLSSLLEYR